MWSLAGANLRSSFQRQVTSAVDAKTPEPRAARKAAPSAVGLRHHRALDGHADLIGDKLHHRVEMNDFFLVIIACEQFKNKKNRTALPRRAGALVPAGVPRLRLP